MSTTTPPRSGTPPSRKFEKKRENSRKFEKIFPECQYIEMYSEKIWEKKRKFEKIWEFFLPPKKSNTKNVYDNPPRSGTPLPSRKFEKKRENLRTFEIFSPTYRQYKKGIRQQLLYLYPPTRSGPPPRSGPRVLAFVFFEKICQIFQFFLRFLVFFLYWRYAREKLPQIFSKLCTFLFSLFFFKISNLNFPFLETWSLNLTKPYHIIRKKTKKFRNVWAQEFLQRLLCFCFYILYVFCWCYSNFLRLLHPQAFIGY